MPELAIERGFRYLQKPVAKGKAYHRIERWSRSFAQAMTLLTAIKEDKVQAECKDRILTVTLPATEAAKTHKVTVKNHCR